MSAKILVVDDEEDVLEIMDVILSVEGYEVAQAKDGNEALELMDDNNYDIVILDVMMPNKSGLEVVRDMKKNKRLRNVPIIIFTALGTSVRMMLNEENQADDYIQKPFSRKDVVNKIEKILRKKIELERAG